MVAEFERYGVSQFRTLVGYLELAGGLGQVIGYYYSQYLFAAASLGLATLMFMAIILRLRLQDPLLVRYYLWFRFPESEVWRKAAQQVQP